MGEGEETHHVQQLSHKYGGHHSHVIHTSSHHLHQTLHDGQTERVSMSQQQLAKGKARQNKSTTLTRIHTHFKHAPHLP